MKQHVLSTMNLWGSKRNIVERPGQKLTLRTSSISTNSTSTSTKDTSILTDSSSDESDSRSVPEEINNNTSSVSSRRSGPVDLDEIEDMMAQGMLISYFEEGEEEDDDDDDSSSSKDNIASKGSLTGPIDLDKLEDDFHYYDHDDDDDEEEEEEIQRNDNEDGNVNEKLQLQSEDIVSVASDKEADALAEDDDDDDDDDDDTIDQMGSSPIDLDNIHDLQTDFNMILDEHEDEFMVWEGNRKKKRESLRLGESCRYKRQSSQWRNAETNPSGRSTIEVDDLDWNESIVY